MSDSNSSGKKPIEEVRAPRASKAKLERLRPEAAEHKKARETLQESEERFRSFTENVPDFIIQLDRKGMILFIKRMYGDVSAEQVAGTSIFAWLEQEYHRAFRKALTHVLKTAEPKVIEYKALGPQAKTRWYLGNVGPIKSNKRVGSVILVARDITRYKQAEEALLCSREEWETTFDAMSDWVAMIDLEGQMLRSNCAGKKFTGISPAQMLGQSICKLVHGTEKRISACPLSKMLETGERAAMEFQVPDTSRWLMVTVDPVIDKQGNIVGAAHITRDITERKKAEELLRNAEKEWRNSFDSLEDVMLIIDTDYNIENINEAGLKLLAKSKEEIIGKKCYQVIDSADRPPEECPCKKSSKTKKVESLDRYEKKFGKYFSIKLSPIFDDNGEIIKFVDLRRDITKRKKAEESLQKQKDKAQKYLDVAGVMLVAINAGGEVTLINKKGCEILGYKEEEIIGKNWFDNFLPKRLVDGIKLVSEKLLTGKLNAAEYFENPVLTKSGEGRLIAWHNTVLRSKQGDIIGTLSSGEDITERKQAEEKLLEYQAQLKALASQLSLAEEHERRRIATELHDQISQSLVVSKLKLEALREAAASDEFGKELNEVCNSLGQTIAETRSLMFDIHSPLLALLGFEAAVAEWLAEQIGEKHGIAAEFEDDGQPKPLDDDIRILLFRDVRELLTNIVRHAHAHKVKVSICKVGSRIRVEVKDNGVGFNPSEITWMPAITGGFGLFSIRERLEEVGGWVEIESKPGHGTTVAITAPLKAEKNAKGR